MMQCNTTFEVLCAGADRIGAGENGRIVWGNGVVTLVFDVRDDAPVRLVGMSGRGMRAVDANIAGEPDAQPIVELRSSIDSGGDNRLQLAKSAAGMKLRFVEAYRHTPADPTAPDALYRLSIVQRDPQSGPTVISVFEACPQLSAVRTYTRLSCAERYPVEAVSSMNTTLPLAAARLTDDQTMIYWGENSWDLENAWHCQPLRSTSLRDRDQKVNPGTSSARFAFRSSSTWSTGEFSPTGIVEGFSEAPNRARSRSSGRSNTMAHGNGRSARTTPACASARMARNTPTTSGSPYSATAMNSRRCPSRSLCAEATGSRRSRK